MVCAAAIANEMRFIDDTLLKKHIDLMTAAGLPIELPMSNVNEIIQQVRLDKKAKGEANIFVLLKGIGNPVTVEVSDDVLKKALLKVESFKEDKQLER